MDWREASRIIGKQDNRDYLLAPAAHAELYRAKAPALADVLESSALSIEAQAFEERDAVAIEAQKTYKATMGRTNLAVLLVSMLGAASLAATILLPGKPAVSQGLSIGTAIVSGIGAFLLFRLREGKLLEDWMTTRAEAETHRIGYFTAIGEAARKTKDASLALLLVEYFRRYQFDVQHQYYKASGEDHRHSANRTVTIGGAGAAVATVSSILGSMGNTWTAVFGALAVAGAAIGAFAIGREQMTQDRRNGERYRRTATTLTGIAKQMNAVRDAAANANGDAVFEFIAAINEHVSLEHRQWLETADSEKAALARLGAALGQTGKPTEEGAPQAEGSPA